MVKEERGEESGFGRGGKGAGVGGLGEGVTHYILV